MKITCDVIRDLLPLYAENIANDDTKALIEEHLEGCDTCMEKLQQMGQTQTMPSALENEFINNFKSKFTKIALNILLVIAIFFAIMNLVSTTLSLEIGFMELTDLELDIYEAFSYETQDGRFYQSTTPEELEEYGEVFDANNIIKEKLMLVVTGTNNFSGSQLTKIKDESTGKYTYYIEAYKRLSSSRQTSSWHTFNGDDVMYYDENYTEPHYSDYVEAVYVATPTKDYLIYGEDVATQKFEVSYPFFGVHIFTLLLIVLSIVCLIVRIKNKNKSKQQLIDIFSLSLIILLLSSVFSMHVIITDWHRFSVYNYYLIFNSIALTSILTGIISIFYVISRKVKLNDSKYNFAIISMALGVVFTMFLEKIRIFEWLNLRLNLDYWYIFYPALPIFLGLLIMLSYFVYKSDDNKPKAIITKSYKITQGIIFFNLVALQIYSLYIYSLKDKLIGQTTYVEGRLFFADFVFFADIINLSTGVIIVYACYSLIKHKDYLMLGIILQAVAICMEKGSYFNMHVPSLLTMENLSFQVFILSYLMVGASVVFLSKLKKGGDNISKI